MRFKHFTLGIAVIIIITMIIAIQFYPKRDSINPDWVKDFNYDTSQIYDITMGLLNPCPFIPVKIGDKEVKLLFDTGNGEGLFLTSAIKGKADYETAGKTTELNADGSYRGEGELVVLKNLTLFTEEYSNVQSSLSDWRMRGFFKINGGIGLQYFQSKVVTIDYKNKKIAVRNEALDYSNLQNDRYVVVPLISSNLNDEKDLLFFQGEINGEKCTIYLDTGSTRSFIDLDDHKGTEIGVKLGDKEYRFISSKMKHDKIGFQGKFEYPLRLAINSDILKSNHFVITIDKIQNNLIICQN
jgi:hypothetical protein